MQPYVSIDIETTGLNPESCQIIQIGMVIDDWVTPIDELQKTEFLVQHRSYKGEPYALGMHSKLFKQLASLPDYDSNKRETVQLQFVKHDKAAFWINHWLSARGIDPKRIQAAGKNFGPFDLQFLRKLPDFDDHLKFNHRIFDPAMFYIDWTTDEKIPDTKVCMDRAGLGGEVAHTALEDALGVVKLLRIARDFALGRVDALGMNTK